MKYYYSVRMLTAIKGQDWRHFIALKKKQVKQYLEDHNLPFVEISMPTYNPAEGLHYVDISKHGL